MERIISVYMEAKDEKMVSQTDLHPMWAKPPSRALSKQLTEVMVLSSMDNIPSFHPPYFLH